MLLSNKFLVAVQIMVGQRHPIHLHLPLPKISNTSDHHCSGLAVLPLEHLHFHRPAIAKRRTVFGMEPKVLSFRKLRLKHLCLSFSAICLFSNLHHEEHRLLLVLQLVGDHLLHSPPQQQLQQQCQLRRQ